MNSIVSLLCLCVFVGYEAANVTESTDADTSSMSSEAAVSNICVCNDDCLLADNGACEDGMAGSIWSDCAPGTDCKDCGSSDRQVNFSFCFSSCAFVCSSFLFPFVCFVFIFAPPSCRL